MPLLDSSQYLTGEEKKEISPTNEKRETYDYNSDGVSEDEELGDLPEDVWDSLPKKSYDTEKELLSDLDAAGCGDLPVVLVGNKPRLITPSDQHNVFTGEYNTHFEYQWAKNRWGRSSSTTKIHLANGRSRDPDLSYWGYPRCVCDKKGNLHPIWGTVPDVIIQFSWKNTRKYEIDAINDIMNKAKEDQSAGAASLTRPRLGYLIKVRFSKKRKLVGGNLETQDMVGLDIYRIPHGATVRNAIDQTNNAQHWRYEPGDPEILITITPQDLGISGIWAWYCGNYVLKASDIFTDMEEYHQERQRRGLPT